MRSLLVPFWVLIRCGLEWDCVWFRHRTASSLIPPQSHRTASQCRLSVRREVHQLCLIFCYLCQRDFPRFGASAPFHRNSKSHCLQPSPFQYFFHKTRFARPKKQYQKAPLDSGSSFIAPYEIPVKQRPNRNVAWCPAAVDPPHRLSWRENVR
jgi:hypothetical protein